MSLKDKVWIYLMNLVDRRWGCHQIPERSFFIGKYQFPMCARCTGVLLGYILAFINFNSKKTFRFYALLNLPILIDWSIQKFKIKESNNIRRFITGILSGYGFIKFCIKSLKFIRSIKL